MLPVPRRNPRGDLGVVDVGDEDVGIVLQRGEEHIRLRRQRELKGPDQALHPVAETELAAHRVVTAVLDAQHHMREAHAGIHGLQDYAQNVVDGNGVIDQRIADILQARDQDGLNLPAAALGLAAVFASLHIGDRRMLVQHTVAQQGLDDGLPVLQCVRFQWQGDDGLRHGRRYPRPFRRLPGEGAVLQIHIHHPRELGNVLHRFFHGPGKLLVCHRQAVAETRREFGQRPGAVRIRRIENKLAQGIGKPGEYPQLVQIIRAFSDFPIRQFFHALHQLIGKPPTAGDADPEILERQTQHLGRRFCVAQALGLDQPPHRFRFAGKIKHGQHAAQVMQHGADKRLLHIPHLRLARQLARQHPGVQHLDEFFFQVLRVRPVFQIVEQDQTQGD